MEVAQNKLPSLNNQGTAVVNKGMGGTFVQRRNTSGLQYHQQAMAGLVHQGQENDTASRYSGIMYASPRDALNIKNEAADARSTNS